MSLPWRAWLVFGLVLLILIAGLIWYNNRALQQRSIYLVPGAGGGPPSFNPPATP